MTNTDAIIEARRKMDAGDFHRAISSRAPRDLLIDNVVLNCGHRSTAVAGIDREKTACTECAEAWMAEQQKAG